jgi:hypothetical protein
MHRACPIVVMALASGLGGCSAQLAGQDALAHVAPGIGSDRAVELCAGLPPSEWDRPSFLQPGGIEAVRPVMGRSFVKLAAPELRGAEILVRSNPARTKHWITRVLRCHLADPVALAFREGFEDPLTVGVPSVSVEQGEGGVTIQITGHDAAEGQEILRRAERLEADSRD